MIYNLHFLSILTYSKKKYKHTSNRIFLEPWFVTRHVIEIESVSHTFILTQK